MDNYTVYMHISPSGKRYIGITSVKPKYRWRNGKGYETQIFYRAIEPRNSPWLFLFIRSAYEILRF